MLHKRKAVPAPSLERELASEYRYASRHHLVPLYILAGAAVLGVLVLICFTVVLWQSMQQDSNRMTVESTIQSAENLYLPTTISPAEKKQYVYSANIRFPISSPYNAFRYAYDPGVAGTSTSASLMVSTDRNLQGLESQLRKYPDKIDTYSASFQQCAKLYIIRFAPGLPPEGGFAPLKDIKLKDGRTAYIQKNITCVPSSVQAMNQLDQTEKDILAVESF
jgi:hypothetical protein